MDKCGLFMVHALAIACSTQGKCSIDIHVQYLVIIVYVGQCINYRCQANVGTVITIPCGDYHESNSVIFTYHNASGNNEVLSVNATYYRLNVTVFDDNTRIVCQPSINGIGEYVYDLVVLCKCSKLVAHSTTYMQHTVNRLHATP